MSTYCSDQELDIDAPGFFDVAYDCFGRDVRIIVDGRSEYLSPDDARAVAAALTRCADLAEEFAAVCECTMPRGEHSPQCHHHPDADEHQRAIWALEGTLRDTPTTNPANTPPATDEETHDA